MDILYDQWSPALSIGKIMRLISSFLTANPNLDCIINPECANIYKKNRYEYERIAKEWTKKYAC